MFIFRLMFAFCMSFAHVKMWEWICVRSFNLYFLVVKVHANVAIIHGSKIKIRIHIFIMAWFGVQALFLTNRCCEFCRFTNFCHYQILLNFWMLMLDNVILHSQQCTVLVCIDWIGILCKIVNGCQWIAHVCAVFPLYLTVQFYIIFFLRLFFISILCEIWDVHHDAETQ